MTRDTYEDLLAVKATVEKYVGHSTSFNEAVRALIIQWQATGRSL